MKDLTNLALTCGGCNLRKGINLAGIDPETGDVTALFDPRKDIWADYFEIRVMRRMPKARNWRAHGTVAGARPRRRDQRRIILNAMLTP
jgi:hypothetical protein